MRQHLKGSLFGVSTTLGRDLWQVLHHQLASASNARLQPGGKPRMGAP